MRDAAMFDASIFDAGLAPDLLRRAHERLTEREEALHAWLSVGHDAEAERDLSRTRLALSWFAIGRYGRCSICNQTLSAEHIESDPADMVCEQCLVYHEGARANANASP